MKKVRIRESKDSKIVIRQIENSNLSIANQYVDRIVVPRNGCVVFTPYVVRHSFMKLSDDKMVNCSYDVHASIYIKSYWLDVFRYSFNFISVRVVFYSDGISVYEDGRNFDVIILDKAIRAAIRRKVRKMVHVTNVVEV